MTISYAVADLLERKPDGLEEYLRRQCAILSGIKQQCNKTINTLQAEVVQLLREADILNNLIIQKIGKLNRTGIYNHETKLQSTIGKFKSHCLREKRYCQRRKIKRVNVNPSMSKWRMGVLTEGTNYHKKETSGQTYLVNFVFADVHVNLKYFSNKK